MEDFVDAWSPLAKDGPAGEGSASVSCASLARSKEAAWIGPASVRDPEFKETPRTTVTKNSTARTTTFSILPI
jgi:hypothetical protein